MKLNKKMIAALCVCIVLLLLVEAYIVYRNHFAFGVTGKKDSVAYTVSKNKFDGTVDEWCESLLDDYVVIDQKKCRIGDQTISKYFLKKQRNYTKKEMVKVIRYFTNDNTELVLQFSDENYLTIGKLDKKVKSKQRTHTVTFVDYDNRVLKKEIVLEGKNANPPTVKGRKHYRFDKWDHSYEKIQSDLELKAVYKEDDTAVSIMVKSVRAKSGQTKIKVPVKVSNNTGILGMTLSLYYDDTQLKLTDIKNGKAFKDILTLTKSGRLKNGCKCVWDGQELEDYQIQDGEIAELVFDIPKTTDPGVYQIKIKCKEGDVVDKNLLPISPLITDGTVTIAD